MSLKYLFFVPQGFVLTDGKLFIPKLKSGIKTIVSQECLGKHLNLTISKTCTNKYFVSVTIDDGIVTPKLKEIKKSTTVGVDLGIKTFAVLSDNQQFENPKHLKKSIVRLKILQKRLSKSKKIVKIKTSKD